MIPKKTIIETIEKFDKKFKELNAQLDKETQETWTIEKFQKWRDMEEAWRKLEDVVEDNLLNYTYETDEE